MIFKDMQHSGIFEAAMRAQCLLPRYAQIYAEPQLSFDARSRFGYRNKLRPPLSLNLGRGSELSKGALSRSRAIFRHLPLLCNYLCRRPSYLHNIYSAGHWSLLAAVTVSFQ